MKMKKDFRVGDIVKVIGYQRGIDDMQDMLGQTRVISSIDDHGGSWEKAHMLEKCNYAWKEGWLEKLEQLKPEPEFWIDDKDFEL